MPKPALNLTGLKFNRLTVIKRVENKIQKSGSINSAWLCLCDCGKKITATGYRIKTGHTKSCGCLFKEVASKNIEKYNENHILPDGEACFNILFRNYKKAAKNLNREFKLTEQEFKIFTKTNCFYCGRQPESIIKFKSTRGNYIYNGIDRKDNKVGYILENCLPCCKTCNYMKRILDFDIFLNQIQKINDHLFKKSTISNASSTDSGSDH